MMLLTTTILNTTKTIHDMQLWQPDIRRMKHQKKRLSRKNQKQYSIVEYHLRWQNTLLSFSFHKVQPNPCGEGGGHRLGRGAGGTQLMAEPEANPKVTGMVWINSVNRAETLIWTRIGGFTFLSQMHNFAFCSLAYCLDGLVIPIKQIDNNAETVPGSCGF